MQTTNQLLDELKARYGLPSDYALGKFLGHKGQSRISHYRSGRSQFDDEEAAKVAGLLDKSPAYVIACAHAERTKSAEQRRIWETIAEKFGGIAAGVVFAVAAAAPAPSAHAAQASAQATAGGDWYYVNRRRRTGFRPEPRLSQTQAAIQRLFFCSKRDQQHGAKHARIKTPSWHVATARHH